MKKAAAVIILSFILAAGLTALGDQVILKSGRVIEGTIIEQTADSVTVETTDADGIVNSQKIPMDKVERVVSDQNDEKSQTAGLPELVLQNGHSQPVYTVAFSPDGKILASASADHTIKLWSVETGGLLRSLEGHSEWVKSVVFSPDGKTLASASDDDTIKLWSVETGDLLRSLEGHSSLDQTVAFSPDGKMFASGFCSEINEMTFCIKGEIEIWSLETGDLLRRFEGHSSDVTSVAFSLDGKTLASGSDDRTIILWSIETGDLLWSLEGHSYPVGAVAFSPDGKTLASGSNDYTIKLWSVETGDLLWSLEGHSSMVATVAFSPDGKTLASGSCKTNETYDCISGDIRIWSVNTGELIRTIEGHSGGVTSVAFSPDGKTLASGSEDETIKLWSVETGDLLWSLEGHSYPVDTVAFSSDGKMLASGSEDNSIEIWSLETGDLLCKLRGHSERVLSVAFSPDGKTLASGGWDNTIKLWSVETGFLVRSMEGHSGMVTTVAFSPDGKTLASGSSGSEVQTIELWSVETGDLLRLLDGHSNWVVSVAFSPDGKTLASGSWDGTIKLWSIETGEIVHSFEGDPDSVTSVSFSPDGKWLVSGGWDNTVKLWSIETGEIVHSIEGHLDNVTSVSFSPDGKWIASGCWDNTVKLWSVETGDLIRPLEGHFDWVESVVFSPDGRILASGSQDTTIKLWNPDTGQLLATLTAFDDGNWFVTDPAGHYDCSGCATNDENSGAKYLRWRVGMELIKPEQVKEQLFVPNLLGKIVRGDTLPDVNLSELSAQLAPKVRFSNIRNDYDIEESKTDVEITVTDVGGGIEGLTLIHAGMPLQIMPEVAVAPGGDPNEKRYIFRDVPLLRGANRFVAVAGSRTGAKSREADVIVNCTSDDLPPLGLFVLTIGIDEYKYKAKNLNFAVSDADAVAEAFRQGGAQLFERGVTEIKLRNGEATRSNIRAALERIKKEAQPNDTVIIYYSGHGAAVGNTWYMLPHELSDFNDKTIEKDAIPHTEIEDALERTLSRRKILILDACQSGQMVLAMQPFRGGPDASLFRAMNTATGAYILASAADAEFAREDYGIKHGVFTYTLLMGLKGAADKNTSGTVEADELVAYTNEQVPELSKKLFRQMCEDNKNLDEYVSSFCDVDAKQKPMNLNASYGGVGGMGPTLVQPNLVSIDLVPVS